MKVGKPLKFQRILKSVLRSNWTLSYKIHQNIPGPIIQAATCRIMAEPYTKCWHINMHACIGWLNREILKLYNKYQSFY